eukprot:m.373434 g.373434  ORF g.373434 m.373434 type:complete len:115 (+) comp56150_c0_seq12:45-389(+)
MSPRLLRIIQRLGYPVGGNGNVEDGVAWLHQAVFQPGHLHLHLLQFLFLTIDERLFPFDGRLSEVATARSESTTQRLLLYSHQLGLCGPNSLDLITVRATSRASTVPAVLAVDS